MKVVRVIQPPGTDTQVVLHVLLENPKSPIADSSWRLIQLIHDIFGEDVTANATTSPPEQIVLGYKRDESQ